MQRRAIHRLWPVVLLVITVILSATEGSTHDNCKDLADFVQKSNLLPNVPDEDGKIVDVKGHEARKMFPGQAAKIKRFKTYAYGAYFKNCVQEPLYMQRQVKSGPYSVSKTTKLSYDVGLELGFDQSLLQIYQFLPKASVTAGIARGSEKVTVSGISVKEGEIKQQCLVAPGWKCEAHITLEEKNIKDRSGIIVNDKILTPTFFPVTVNGKPLYSYVWLQVPEN
ncbi:hypothetical protein EC968_006848 [Mortierella alpina]|nr:hypothetical protein EC968_006848 [Mortierella alpina]